MMASNLLQSDTKINQKLNGNVIIYKTTEFPNIKENPKNSQRSQSKTQTVNNHHNNNDMNQYNFEYSYQDPVYQVYTNTQHGNENSSNFITPNFTSFHVQGVNSTVYNGQNQVMNNQSRGQMQMSQMTPQMSPQLLDDGTNSMSTYITQNNMGYVEEDRYTVQPQNNMIYSRGGYDEEQEEYDDNVENNQGDNLMVYQKGWSKKKLRNKGKEFKKFRPHSNNVRTMNQGRYNSKGIWGVNKNFRSKFHKKRNFGQTSGLSKNKCFEKLKNRKQIKRKIGKTKVKYEQDENWDELTR
jgi:hypothetical protein